MITVSAFILWLSAVSATAALALGILTLGGLAIMRGGAPMRSALDWHVGGLVFLGLLTLILFLARVFGLGVPGHWALLPALLLPLIGAWYLPETIRGSGRGPRDLIIAASMLLVCALLAALVYVGQRPDSEGLFIPADGNRDVFAYLLRARALLSDGADVPVSINGLTVAGIAASSSKLAGSAVVALFDALSDHPGFAATAAVVAVKAAILHLLISVFPVRRHALAWSLVLAVTLALLPILTMLQTAYYLSQLIFIYLCMLTIVGSRLIFMAPGYRPLLTGAVFGLYAALLYPAAIPAFLAIVGAAVLIVERGWPRPRRWAPLMLSILLAGTGMSLVLLFTNGDIYHHLDGEYYPVSYLSLSGQLLAELAFRPSLWNAEEIGLDAQLEGLVLDLALLVLVYLVYLVYRRRTAEVDDRLLRFLFVALVLSWLAYQLVFLLSDANYRAFKLNSTFVTLFFLLFFVQVLALGRSWISLVVLLICLAFVIPRFEYFLDYRLSATLRAEDLILLQAMGASESDEVAIDVEDMRVNMLAPLIVGHKTLYTLGSSYFGKTRYSAEFCRALAEEGGRLYYMTGQRGNAPAFDGTPLSDAPGYSVVQPSLDQCR